ncbi:unnamed protein product [Adineta steineri]|uniref:Uncharacterized protein n=1 Tax=Adineta steineri TaxID=433720 RepID=A0A815DQT5_9BILA|nr:unnamed protein product [Adineta steineri]CAF4095854.1 unnamed protein product [Adineta steineri]
MLEILSDDELMEKRIELRQKLKNKLLTLSPSGYIFDSFNNFIPNSRDLDFIEKQGLDCAINYLIINSLHKFHKQIPNICSICQIDHTENWWYSLSNAKQIIYLCDQCEQNRIRHVILEQHRQSMKSAFLQAKESERRLEVNYQQHKKFTK